MDKRKIENARVKRSVEDAFFFLLKEKSFSEITVTDLVKRSGVARTSYYHNFNSKEDIIREYIRRLREEFDLALGHSTKNFGNTLTVPHLTMHLSCYLKEQHNVLLLYDNGFGTLMLEETNRYTEELLGDMPHNSIDRYQLYFISGAIFNTMVQWMKTGARESPNEMARMLLELINKLYQPLLASSDFTLQFPVAKN